MSTRLRKYRYEVNIPGDGLEAVRTFLAGKSNFLLRLLENPILLEHETFTELLRAVFHLREELLNRDDIATLPDTDYHHLEGDISRSYSLLVNHWLEYMHHLKSSYPYLFSLAMRTNPFDKEASAVVR